MADGVVLKAQKCDPGGSPWHELRGRSRVFTLHALLPSGKKVAGIARLFDAQTLELECMLAHDEQGQPLSWEQANARSNGKAAGGGKPAASPYRVQGKYDVPVADNGVILVKSIVREFMFQKKSNALSRVMGQFNEENLEKLRRLYAKAEPIIRTEGRNLYLKSLQPWVREQ